MSLNQYLSAEDFQRAARRRLPHAVYEYVAGGTEEGASLRNNRACFQALDLRPRGLTGVAQRSQAVSLWGQEYAGPLGVAPMGFAAICRHRCDLELARAAQAHRLPFILSGASNVALEDIQQEVGNVWYQGYFPGDTDRLSRIIARLKRAGVDVLVVTSDTPVAANRENNQRNGFTVPFRPSWPLFLDGLRHPRWSVQVFLRTLIRDGVPRYMNLYEEPGPTITSEPGQGFRGGRDLLTWEHMRWLRDHWDGRLVVKGILHPDDARMAVACGMDGVIVSNHGGRQLDGAMAPLTALPAICAQVPSDFPVMLDGGIRRGTDIIKAVALGARMVFAGRPVLFGAAIAGEQGASRVLEILQTEVDRNLALLGCPQLADLDTDFLDPAGLARFMNL